MEEDVHIIELPEAEREMPRWEIAIEWLMLVGEHGGDPMVPRIAVMKALRHLHYDGNASRSIRSFVDA